MALTGLVRGVLLSPFCGIAVNKKIRVNGTFPTGVFLTPFIGVRPCRTYATVGNVVQRIRTLFILLYLLLVDQYNSVAIDRVCELGEL